MKASLCSICVVALLLSACDKEVPKPAPRPVPELPKVAAPDSPPAGTMSAEDKMKAMEAAKAVAKSAGGKAD